MQPITRPSMYAVYADGVALAARSWRCSASTLRQSTTAYSWTTTVTRCVVVSVFSIVPIAIGIVARHEWCGILKRAVARPVHSFHSSPPFPISYLFLRTTPTRSGSCSFLRTSLYVCLSTKLRTQPQWNRSLWLYQTTTALHTR